MIYNGIDSREFIHEKDYAVSEDKPKRILYAGAISPHRGLHVLLEAFKLVVKRYPNVRLDLVGPEGNYALQDTFDIEMARCGRASPPTTHSSPCRFSKPNSSRRRSTGLPIGRISRE